MHEVVVGAFRARGMTFEGWCHENGLTPTNARNATFGQSRGEAGQRIMRQIIEAVGIEFMRDAYRRRVAEHLAQIKQGAA